MNIETLDDIKKAYLSLTRKKFLSLMKSLCQDDSTKIPEKTDIKWTQADEIVTWAINESIETTTFSCSSTPHIRFLGCVDYWPATQRFYDLKLRKKGTGVDNLKEHLLLCR